jgi:DNA-binding Lrp family transcriptional regulator
MNRSDKLDGFDRKLLECMLSGLSNREISNRVRRPLSTVQRRTRQILESGLIKTKYELDYKQFGYKKGLLHIYLNDGNVHEIVESIASLEHILSVSIHIGNSDVVAEYACKDSSELLEMMARLKKIPAVERIVWSEEVSSIDATHHILPIQKEVKSRSERN